eukprot:6877282-Prymnesium_polylepis.1
MSPLRTLDEPSVRIELRRVRSALHSAGTSGAPFLSIVGPPSRLFVFHGAGRDRPGRAAAPEQLFTPFFRSTA